MIVLLSHGPVFWQTTIYYYYTYLVYSELFVKLYLCLKALIFTGHKSWVLQHLSLSLSLPKSWYVVAMSPVPHHFVPEKLKVSSKLLLGIIGWTSRYYYDFFNAKSNILRWVRIEYIAADSAYQQQSYRTTCSSLRFVTKARWFQIENTK